MTTGGASRATPSGTEGTRLLLVRHGQSEWNAHGRWQGQSDPPLSDRGRNEALMAAATLGHSTGSSWLHRLCGRADGGDHVAELGQTGRSRSSRAPRDRRRRVLWADERRDRGAMPDTWKALREGRLDTFPGGESRKDFRVRVLRALESWLRGIRRSTILVVTHGGDDRRVERYLGVHPGVGVRNLEGRWFEFGRVAPGGRRPRSRSPRFSRADARAPPGRTSAPCRRTARTRTRSACRSAACRGAARCRYRCRSCSPPSRGSGRNRSFTTSSSGVPGAGERDLLRGRHVEVERREPRRDGLRAPAPCTYAPGASHRSPASRSRRSS